MSSRLSMLRPDALAALADLAGEDAAFARAVAVGRAIGHGGDLLALYVLAAIEAARRLDGPGFTARLREDLAAAGLDPDSVLPGDGAAA